MRAAARERATGLPEVLRAAPKSACLAPALPFGILVSPQSESPLGGEAWPRSRSRQPPCSPKGPPANPVSCWFRGSHSGSAKARSRRSLESKPPRLPNFGMHPGACRSRGEATASRAPGRIFHFPLWTACKRAPVADPPALREVRHPDCLPAEDLGEESVGGSETRARPRLRRRRVSGPGLLTVCSASS